LALEVYFNVIKGKEIMDKACKLAYGIYTIPTATTRLVIIAQFRVYTPKLPSTN